MPTYYLLGIFFVYFGLMFSLFEILLDPFLLTKPWQIQVVLIAALGVIFDYFTIGVVLAPARLDFEAYTISMPHFAGDNFGGIRWTEKQKDLRVWIRNPSTAPYDNVDVVVDTNAILNGAAQLQKIPTCTIGLSNEVEAHATVRDSSGTEHVISPPIQSTLGLGYRIVCDKLPPLSAIQLTLATSVDHSGNSGLFGDVVQKPNLGIGDTGPTIVTIKGVYTSGFKIRNVNATLSVPVR